MLTEHIWIGRLMGCGRGVVSRYLDGGAGSMGRIVLFSTTGAIAVRVLTCLGRFESNWVRKPWCFRRRFAPKDEDAGGLLKRVERGD